MRVEMREYGGSRGGDGRFGIGGGCAGRQSSRWVEMEEVGR